MGAEHDRRRLNDQVFSRTAGAHLIGGNDVRLLRDAKENYPAWLAAIEAAQHFIHFETYILHGDETGQRFADAFAKKAAEGVRVRLIYDWVGCLGRTSRNFWRRLRENGVDVRSFNPPRLDHPLGWVVRDHRKCLIVDGRVAFVTGLCVGKMWEGDAALGRAPWRDTGVSLRGPAVSEVALAFADSWAATGAPLPLDERAPPGEEERAGTVDVRVVASTPGNASLYRLDPLVASLARRTLWLTDAYFAGTAPYVQALRSAAEDGVDVRLLVPGPGSDIPIMQRISRTGYRALINAGIRVFEWNGPMLHAKTAVADARWARVGSTNLNLSSWIGNRELDLVIENEAFGQAMESMFLADLAQSTEIVLAHRRGVGPLGGVPSVRARGGGSASRAAAGAVRLGSALSSALAARRVHQPTERGLMVQGALVLALVALLGFLWPRLLAWPLATLCLWFALALLSRAVRKRRVRPAPPETADGALSRGDASSRPELQHPPGH